MGKQQIARHSKIGDKVKSIEPGFRMFWETNYYTCKLCNYTCIVVYVIILHSLSADITHSFWFTMTDDNPNGH